MCELDCKTFMQNTNTISSIIDKAYFIICPIPQVIKECGEWSKRWGRFHKSKAYDNLHTFVGTASGLRSPYPIFIKEANKIFGAVYDAIFQKDIKNLDFEANKKSFMQEHAAEIDDFEKHVIKAGNYIIPTQYRDLYEDSAYGQFYNHLCTTQDQLKILKSEVKEHSGGTALVIQRIEYVESLVKTLRSESMPMILL